MAVLNPKDAPFNAKGDGKADDTSALQNCFNAARSGKHSVLIPAGTYRHTKALTVDSIKVAGVNGKPGDGPVTMLYADAPKYRTVVMKGTGPELTKMRIHGYPTPRRPSGIGASPWLSAVWVWPGTRNFRLTHLWIEGENKANSQPNIHAIYVDDATDGYVARNTVMYTTADSLHFRTNSAGKNARNIVEYNYVWQSGDDGTAFVGYTSGHVTDCISRYNFVGGNRGGRGVTAVGTEGCQLVGNLVYGGPNGRAGIMIAAEGGRYDTGGNRHLIVRDNTVVGAGGDGKSVEGDKGVYHGAIHVYGGAGTAETNLNHHMTITGNQVFRAKNDGLVFDGGAAATHVTLTNNVFHGCAANAIRYHRKPTSLSDSGNSGNLSATALPGFKALGGAVSKEDAARKVGANTTWTVGGTTPEPVPTVYLPPSVSVKEGGDVTVTVTKSGTGACSVTVATAPGTADPKDFTAIPPTALKFGAAETSKTVTVKATADSLIEQNETLTLDLSSPSGCTVSNASCVVTIVNADVPVPPKPVPLPFPPPATCDVTIDLNTQTARTFVGTAYQGKAIRVIPKPTMDTAAGLFFDGCASVTIIGGYFKPSGRAVYGAVDSGASLYFNNCGAVYLEGVHLDNASIAQGHGVLVHARDAETEITLQNSRIVNVAGLDTGIRGTVFSTGSAATGRTGSVRIHNLTASTRTGTRGLYLPPEAGGGLTRLLLSNVNVFRAGGAGAFGFFHFLNSAADYDAFGYPVILDNVWAAPGPGQKVETHLVWPNAGAAGNAAFGEIFAAVRAPNPLDGNRIGAHWPLMSDRVRDWEGFVYEGAPPQGDFVPANKVGLTYAAGIDLVETTPPNPVSDPVDAATPVAVPMADADDVPDTRNVPDADDAPPTPDPTLAPDRTPDADLPPTPSDQG
jgi:hypothetical protein